MISGINCIMIRRRRVSDYEQTIEDVYARAQRGGSSARSTPPLLHCCFGDKTGCRTAVAFSTVRIGSGWPCPHGLQHSLKLKTGACERLRLEAGDIVRGRSAGVGDRSLTVEIGLGLGPLVGGARPLPIAPSQHTGM